MNTVSTQIRAITIVITGGVGFIGSEKTVKWYLENQEWMNNITNGAHEQYYEKMYSKRV